MSTQIQVYENSDPLLEFTLRRKTGGIATDPVVLTSIDDIEFVVKEDLSDPLYKFTYKNSTGKIAILDNGSVNDASVITVQCAKADLTPAGIYYWHLNVITGSHRDTVDDGFFEVLDV